MLTKSPRHTKGRLLWRPRTSLRSLCSAKEELEVRIPQIPLMERDPSHLAQCWITAGWRDILISSISAPGMMSLLICSSWLHGEGVCLCLTGKRSPTQTMYASATQAPIETKNPRVNLLVTKWQHVWLLALDRRRKLNDAMDRLEEVIKQKPAPGVTETTSNLQISAVLVVHISLYVFCAAEGIRQLWLRCVAEALHALDEP